MATIQVRNVPDEVHRIYQVRAAQAGQSLQEYLLGLLVETSQYRTPAEIVADVEARLEAEGADGFASVSVVDAVRSDRDAH